MAVQAPKKILIICTRRLGDVLFTTPLVHTLHHHWPKTRIDLLVFKGTESVLKANPEIHQTLTIEERPKLRAHLRLIQSIFQVYDYALATLPSDRAILYAFLAAKKSIGVLARDKQWWWKRYLLSKAILFDNDHTHTVLMNLRLAELLQLKALPDVRLHWTRSDCQRVLEAVRFDKIPKLAVLHLFPKFVYKAWSYRAWCALAAHLQQLGYTLAFSGDQADQAQQRVDALIDTLPKPAFNLVGKMSLSQLAYLLNGSQLYIGPDTVVTHMAAALGIPTIALFGPSNPVKWGPWPKTWNRLMNPYQRQGSQQQQNVYLVQGPGYCVPCLEEGCQRHRNSFSRCLEQLSVQQVIAAIATLTQTNEATQFTVQY